MSGGELILYTTNDGQARINLRALDGTVWLTQLQLAELIGVSVANVNVHIKNILADGELTEEATIIDYLITKFTGLHASSFGKGFVGFVLSAVVLYVTQYFVAGYTVSWMAAIIGALVYGVVDYLLPGDQQ